MEKCAGGDGCQNEYAGKKATAQPFSRAVFFGLNALSIADENFGGAEDADELDWQEMMDEPFPAPEVIQESTLANGGLNCFGWLGHWWDRAFVGGEPGNALAGALPLGIQHIQPFT